MVAGTKLNSIKQSSYMLIYMVNRKYVEIISWQDCFEIKSMDPFQRYNTLRRWEEVSVQWVNSICVSMQSQAIPSTSIAYDLHTGWEGKGMQTPPNLNFKTSRIGQPDPVSKGKEGRKKAHRFERFLRGERADIPWASVWALQGKGPPRPCMHACH